MDGTAVRVLVAWYGIYQAGHLVFNVRYLLDPGRLPFPARAGGWSPQLTALLYGTAAADAVNAALALGFVVGFFAHRRWHTWLGTLTLTVSVYTAAVFTYGTITVGARHGQLAAHLALYLPFLPVVALLAVWSTHHARGR